MAQNDELKSQSGFECAKVFNVVAALDLVKQVAVQNQKKLEEKNYQLSQTLADLQVSLVEAA